MKGCTGRLRERVKNGDLILVGCIMDCRSGAAVEMYHECGYDLIMIDREHTALNSETVLEHIRLARALDMPAMVRGADHDELVPELISDTLKEDFDLKLYTDVNL